MALRMHRYVSDYLYEIEEHLRELTDTLIVTVCALIASIILTILLPLNVVYIPIRDLVLFVSKSLTKKA